MVTPIANMTPSSLLTVRWLPSLGVLLAALGCVCVLAGTADLTTTMMRPPGASARTLTEESTGSTPNSRPAGRLSDVACRGFPPGRTGSCAVIGAERPWLTPELTAQSPEAVTPREGAGVAGGCQGTERERGTRSESALLSANALQSDPRKALAAMAVAHHVRRGFCSRSHPIIGLVSRDSRRADSDDRVANALFIPALTPPPESSRGNERSPLAVDPPDRRDVRWDLSEMAGAQRGDRTGHCPCPVYPIDHPSGGPR